MSDNTYHSDYHRRSLLSGSASGSFITKDIPLLIQSQLLTVEEIESELGVLIWDDERKLHD